MLFPWINGSTESSTPQFFLLLLLTVKENLWLLLTTVKVYPPGVCLKGSKFLSLIFVSGAIFLNIHIESHMHNDLKTNKF